MAFSGFINIADVKGESSDTDHPDWIEFESFEHHVLMPGGAGVSASGGLAGGKADCGDFKITKLFDKATPHLCEYVFSAKEPATIEVHTCDTQAGKQFTFMKWVFEDCIISGYRQFGNSSNEDFNRPQEEISFRFARLKWEYTPRDDAGKAGAAEKGGWDRKTNALYT